jgi:poly-gamma-glutamate capsule biosynthesis protein CapA/YwtB (metallophosphatase superfamily)
VDPVASPRTLVQAWLIIVVLAATAFLTSVDLTGAAAGATDVAIDVVDEVGRPVEAEFVAEGARTGSDDGRIRLSVDQPVFGFVEAEGYLDEPVVVSPATPRMVVPLVSATGPGGERRVLHFGGDTMVGRRYLTGEAGGGVPDAEAARSLVADIAPLFAAADLSTVNLESVVGDFDLADAYPGKRFLLATAPHGLASLEALGVDVVTLGNNHAYDWGAAGLDATLDALESAGFGVTGAGPDPASAREPAITEVDGLRIATLSYTSVTGDVVNDALPTADTPVPADLAAGDRWQYEERAVAIELDGEEFWAPVPMRAGDAWRRFESLEAEVSGDEAAAIWAALTSDGAFPELQDWVARRGHGGAALHRRDDVADDIAAAREEGADIVVVQVHGGLQYAPVVSGFFAEAARDAAEAGADIVIGHHPHVLQGFDWVGDVPIAHSLGNLVFDQDFGATVQTVVLRVVVDDEGVVEVRAYPVELQGHRPVPVAGADRQAIADLIAARSVAGVESKRSAEGSPVLAPSVAWDGASISDAGWGLRVDRADGSSPVAPACQLLLNPSFEDGAADGRISGGAHWRFGSGAETVRSSTAAHGRRVLLIDGVEDSFVRPLHRLAIGGRQGGEPAYELSLRVRGSGSVGIRVDGYRFTDSDPTRDPTSELRGSWGDEWVVDSDEWSELRFPLPDDLVASDVNSVLPYVTYSASLGQWVEIDDVRLTETDPGTFGCRR